MQRESKLCTEKQNFSLTQCIDNFVSDEVGCSLNWFHKGSLQKCTSQQQLEKTQKLLQKIRNYPFEETVKITGCYPKCSKTLFIINKISEEEIVWHTDWLSEE